MQSVYEIIYLLYHSGAIRIQDNLSAFNILVQSVCEIIYLLYHSGAICIGDNLSALSFWCNPYTR